MGWFWSSKWVAVIVSAAIGMAVMYLLGLVLGSTIDYDTTFGELAGIVLGLMIASYLITGFIGGFWTRGTKSGMNAALVLLAANIIISLFQGVFTGLPGIIILVIVVIICGALGGWIGKLVRGKEKVDKSTDIEIVE